MSSRPLEHLVLLSVTTSGNYEEGEETSVVLLAWLIHNISKNKTVSQQEVFVCPKEGPPPAKALPASVASDSVQNGCSLEDALKKLHESLTKLAGTTFSIMTNGPRTLRHYLHPEARQLEISLHKYLSHYLDLNKEVRLTFPSAPVTNDLDKMAEYMGCGSSDDPKVGLVELLLFCKIVTTLISEGHVFHKLEVIKQYDASVTAPDRALVKPDCILSLRGLPYQASAEDVVGFLVGLNIVPGGIAFGTNQMGRRTGGALVVMETAELAELAQERNRHYIGQRYVEVSLASPDDFWQLVDDSVGEASESMYVVRMQGLPYRVTEEEIVEFFADASATVTNGPEGVLLVLYPDGRASGNGYAVFNTEKDLKSALSCDKQTIPNYNRYVELFKSSVKDLKSVLSASAGPEQQAQFSRLLGITITGNPEIEGLRGRDRKCVKLRGLPYDSKPDDVLAFFGDLKNDIASKGVHMVLNANNKPTGDCYVQMKSEDSAREAYDNLNKKYMGSRYIEVFQCSGDEVAKVLMEQSIGGGGGYRGDRTRGGGRGFGGGGRRHRTSGGSGTVVKARGLPYRVEAAEVADFFSDYEVRDSDVELLYNRDGRPLGIALVSFQSRQLAEEAVREKNRKYLGQRYVELSFQSE